MFDLEANIWSSERPLEANFKSGAPGDTSCLFWFLCATLAAQTNCQNRAKFTRATNSEICLWEQNRKRERESKCYATKAKVSTKSSSDASNDEHERWLSFDNEPDNWTSLTCLLTRVCRVDVVVVVVAGA